MFDSLQGYCSHFASSMTMLLRAADIPARMVAGYRGGEWNELGGYLIVKQKHAHAWVEAWLDGYGWVRIDPTAAIPPERVLDTPVSTTNASLFSGSVARQLSQTTDLSGLLKARNQTVAQKAGDSDQKTNVSDLNSALSFIKDVGIHVWSLGVYFWDTWIQGFDYERQKALFSFSWILNALLLLVVAVLFVSVYVWLTILVRKGIGGSEKTAVQRIYDQLRDQLKKHGLDTSDSISHRSLLINALKLQRFDEEKLRGVFNTYELLRYAKDEQSLTKQDLKTFKRQVRTLLRKQKPV